MHSQSSFWCWSSPETTSSTPPGRSERRPSGEVRTRNSRESVRIGREPPGASLRTRMAHVAAKVGSLQERWVGMCSCAKRTRSPCYPNAAANGQLTTRVSTCSNSRPARDTGPFRVGKGCRELIHRAAARRDVGRGVLPAGNRPVVTQLRPQGVERVEHVHAPGGPQGCGPPRRSRNSPEPAGRPAPGPAPGW